MQRTHPIKSLSFFFMFVFLGCIINMYLMNFHQNIFVKCLDEYNSSFSHLSSLKVKIDEVRGWPPIKAGSRNSGKNSSIDQIFGKYFSSSVKNHSWQYYTKHNKRTKKNRCRSKYFAILAITTESNSNVKTWQFFDQHLNNYR